MKFLNKALEEGNVSECHSLLMKPEALLPNVLNRSAFLYYNELNKEKKKKQQVLGRKRVNGGVMVRGNCT